MDYLYVLNTEILVSKYNLRVATSDFIRLKIHN